MAHRMLPTASHQGNADQTARRKHLRLSEWLLS